MAVAYGSGVRPCIGQRGPRDTAGTQPPPVVEEFDNPNDNLDKDVQGKDDQDKDTQDKDK
jgi:hypothetical protein